MAERMLLVFLTGVMTSFGPCMAPRMLAVASFSAIRARGIFAYFCGILTSYGSLAFGVSLLSQIAQYRTFTERALAVALIFAGFAGLWSQKSCDHSREPSALGAYGLGVTMGFLISPCCSPAVMSLVSLSVATGAVQTAAFLCAFALGQLVPSCILAAAPQLLRRMNGFVAWREPVQICSAILSLCLGGYYALLSA